MSVTTNNIPRDLVPACELPKEARADFDYLDWDAIDNGTDDESFFQYRGQWWSLGEFMAFRDPVWHGIAPQTYFSGVCVRLLPDNYQVVVGHYYEG